MIDLWGKHAAWISFHKTKDEGPSSLEVERIRGYASGWVLCQHPPFHWFCLCFFHVDSVDWLILNLLQTSTAFKPQSNLPSISIFSLQCSVSMLTLRLWQTFSHFSVLSVCWCLGFDTDILNANRKKHRVFILFWMHLFLMSKITSKIRERKHLFLI